MRTRKVPTLLDVLVSLNEEPQMNVRMQVLADVL